MKDKQFAIGEALHLSWETWKSNLRFFMVLELIVWPIETMLFILMILHAFNNVAGIHALLRIIDFLFSLIVVTGFIQIGLRFADRDKANFVDLYAGLPRIWSFFLGTLLYGLIVMAGLILLIVPGVIWAVKYQFYGYFIVDQGISPIQALTRSGQITKGVKGYLFLFDLTLFGIALLGTLGLLIGQIVAGPINLLAIAYVYRRLLATEPNPPGRNITNPMHKAKQAKESTRTIKG